MKYKNTNKWISRLSAVSALLLLAAVFTVSNSFSFSKTKSMEKFWDVYFAEPVVESNNGKVIVNNDRLVIGIKLSNNNPSFNFSTSINNDGDFDAVLADFIVTDLSKIKVGKSSKTGKEYTMENFVNVAVTYTKDDNINGIRKGEPVKNGDTLIRTTKNDVSVNISLRDKIDDDMRLVFSEYLNSKVELNLSIDAVYQQK